MKAINILLIVLSLAFASVSMTGCLGKKDNAETQQTEPMGEEMMNEGEEVMEDAGDAMEEAGDEAADAMEDVAE